MPQQLLLRTSVFTKNIVKVQRTQAQLFKIKSLILRKFLVFTGYELQISGVLNTGLNHYALNVYTRQNPRQHVVLKKTSQMCYSMYTLWKKSVCLFIPLRQFLSWGLQFFRYVFSLFKVIKFYVTRFMRTMLPVMHSFCHLPTCQTGKNRNSED